jgi:hypothetical protein
MRTATPLVVLAVVLSACASRKEVAQATDLPHDPETCTIDAHNHTGEILADAQAGAEEAAREAAWHARERERTERAKPGKPRTAQPGAPKTEKPDSAQPRLPPPR